MRVKSREADTGRRRTNGARGLYIPPTRMYQRTQAGYTPRQQGRSTAAARGQNRFVTPSPQAGKLLRHLFEISMISSLGTEHLALNMPAEAAVQKACYGS